MQDFTKLKVWQKAHALAIDLKRTIDRGPGVSFRLGNTGNSRKRSRRYVGCFGPLRKRSGNSTAATVSPQCEVGEYEVWSTSPAHVG